MTIRDCNKYSLNVILPSRYQHCSLWWKEFVEQVSFWKSEVVMGNMEHISLIFVTTLCNV